MGGTLSLAGQQRLAGGDPSLDLGVHAARADGSGVLADAYAILARIKMSGGGRDAARDLLWRMEQYARDVDIP